MQNWALGKQSYQSSNFDAPYGPEKAVDGNTGVGFANTQETHGQWWRVNLQHRVAFIYAQIFARDGNCNDGDHNLYPCGKKAQYQAAAYRDSDNSYISCRGSL